MSKFVPSNKVINIEIEVPSRLNELDGKILIFDGRNFLGCCLKDGEVALPEISSLESLDFGRFSLFQLGVLNGRSCYLLDGANCDDLSVAFKRTHELDWLEMRGFMPQLTLGECSALIRGYELQYWWRRRQYCGVCGGKNELSATEIAMCCPQCGEVFYPEISLAVICGIVKGDEILLAHNNKFVPELYGLIAGFVEIGETMEQAVAREIKEEINVNIKNIRYFSSQCWPYPSVLMAGFWADYDSGEIIPDEQEISDAKFFRYDQLPAIPRVGSIARRIIDEFVRLKTTV